jgi:outer membrane biosynthesis protein TonB
VNANPAINVLPPYSGPPRARWNAGIVLSIVAHVAMFGGALAYARFTPPHTVAQPPIMAKLVRLGKQRPDDLLPRLSAPPSPPSAKEAPVAPTPPPATAAPPAEKPAPPKTEGKGPAETASPERDPREALKRQKRLSDALSRLGAASDEPTSPKGEAPTGREDGSPIGNAEKAEAGDEYAALVQDALRKNFIVPTTISDKEKLYLFIELRIFIASDGRITRFTIDRKSGSDVFDRAVESTLARTEALPSPPTILMRTYATEGLGVRFKP